ncbi:MAG: serine/threonine-protein phosphatase [Clostridia bacterium]|nr:serine/threonine-protein phosphatase [Clostridia bacterium]
MNNQLCETNEAEMFLTVWLGILEISSGKMICANAGHEYPAIARKGGEFELIHDKHGFVLAGMAGARYREYGLQLNEGDRLFVYTDGVAEATDAHNELFGTDRMLAALNKTLNENSEKRLIIVKNEVDAFVGSARGDAALHRQRQSLRPNRAKRA